MDYASLLEDVYKLFSEHVGFAIDMRVSYNSTKSAKILGVEKSSDSLTLFYDYKNKIIKRYFSADNIRFNSEDLKVLFIVKLFPSVEFSFRNAIKF